MQAPETTIPFWTSMAIPDAKILIYFRIPSNLYHDLEFLRNSDLYKILYCCNCIGIAGIDGRE